MDYNDVNKTPHKKQFEEQRIPSSSLRAVQCRANMSDIQEYETPRKIQFQEQRTPSRRQSAVICRARLSNIQEYETTRKSARKITPSKRYGSEEFVKKPSKRRIKREKEPLNKSTESESDENIVSNEKNKAIDLFAEKIDVEGKKIYGFNTPRKGNSMLKMALSTPKTPKLTSLTVNKTPDSKRKKENDLQSKTPRHVRNIMKKEITKHIQNIKSDFSGDESEYKPDTTSESDFDTSSNESLASESNTEDESIEQNRIKTRHGIAPILPQALSTQTQRKPFTRNSKKMNDFIPESEGYFNSHANNKIMTSNHTLDRLKNPRLPADHLFSLLNSLKLSTEHEKSISSVFDEYKINFKKWMYLLDQGFNILLYGLGSKKDLLQSFQCEMLRNRTVLVINGFFPSLTIKNILDSILIDILDLTSSPANLNEAFNVVQEEMDLIPRTHIFIIVHNIDGSMLRNSRAQEILSRLAKITNIHLLASIDHISTPLLWDNTKLSNYNFTWWDVTTMLPYTNETAFENSLMVQNSGELALSSMRNVFLSLTTNARGIYLLIVKYQLTNKGNPNFQGILFKDLYWGCRDAFLVSSDLALRAQLTEFLDHKLVRSKRNLDGSETLKIPIETGLLQQFLDEQEEK